MLDRIHWSARRWTLPLIVLALASCGAPRLTPLPTHAQPDAAYFDDVAVDDGWVMGVREDFSEIDADPKGNSDWFAFRDKLDRWPPGQIANDTQRVWNLLCAAVVCDLGRGAFEAETAGHVFNRLRKEISAPRLAEITRAIVDGNLPGPALTGIAALDLGADGQETTGEYVDRARLLSKKLYGRALGFLPRK